MSIHTAFSFSIQALSSFEIGSAVVRSDFDGRVAAKSGDFTKSGFEADSFFMTVTVCFDYAATTGRVDHNYFRGWVWQ
jgi:hypothetical protein